MLHSFAEVKTTKPMLDERNQCVQHLALHASEMQKPQLTNVGWTESKGSLSSKSIWSHTPSSPRRSVYRWEFISITILGLFATDEHRACSSPGAWAWASDARDRTKTAPKITCLQKYYIWHRLHNKDFFAKFYTHSYIPSSCFSLF